MILSGKLSVIGMILCLIVFSCTEKSESTDESSHLGVIDFQTTGDEAAQAKFEEGLLLLHSFEYEDAREKFLEAQEIDGEMVMAYWGEAMSYNHSLWRNQDFEKATAALENIEKTPEGRVEKAGTELEKDFIRAINLLYEAKKTKKERDQAYTDFMAELYGKYNGNHEIAAFYALSLLGSPGGRSSEVFEKGAKIAEGILEENMNHPGALHYLIHSYDDPDHAKLALKAADSYAKVAPDASHALHMPSHIYVAMGMWKEVVSSNEVSYKASVTRMVNKELDNDARGYHSYHWLLYGYMQQERFDDAFQLIKDMETYVNETPSERARNHLIFMKTTFLACSGDWTHEASKVEIDYKDLNIVNKAKDIFAQGMTAYANIDDEKFNQAIEELTGKINTAEVSLEGDEITVCNSTSRTKNTKGGIDRAKTMLFQLKAMKANLSKDSESAEHYLKQAVELEEKSTYSFGPPTVAKPSYELYAEWLLDNNRAKEALAHFEKQLERSPNRTITLKGKLEAAKALEE